MSTRSRQRKAPLPLEGAPVTTLELFFDLVFVFSVTQLTDLILNSDGASGYLHAAAVLIVTWWMYDGYAWLSNNVSPTTTSTRLPMLIAMAALLVMAISIPAVFSKTAWQFAVAYIVVVLIHAWSFSRSSVGSSAIAIRRILPTNLGVALCVLAAAAVDDEFAWTGWAAAVAILAVSIARRNESGFSLRADHFAERHQLIIIIALGETVIATGVGAAGHVDDTDVLIAVLASMALVSALWWVYFGGDDSRRAEAFTSFSGERLAHEALWAYGLAHLLHISGLVLLAVGLHEVVHDPGHALDLRIALTMGAGCAGYLGADLLFRLRLSLGFAWPLAVAALLCLVTAFLGTEVSGLAQLLALTVVGAFTVLALFQPRRQLLP